MARSSYQTHSDTPNDDTVTFKDYLERDAPVTEPVEEAEIDRAPETSTETRPRPQPARRQAPTPQPDRPHQSRPHRDFSKARQRRSGSRKIRPPAPQSRGRTIIRDTPFGRVYIRQFGPTNLFGASGPTRRTQNRNAPRQTPRRRRSSGGGLFLWLGLGLFLLMMMA